MIENDDMNITTKYVETDAEPIRTFFRQTKATVAVLRF